MSTGASVREPNSEQKLAIEHKGGALLSAGAGSGKTFVLVEHIVYLLREFKKSYVGSPEVLENELRKYLSSIVLMTFTKKAAGELQIRLMERMATELEINDGDEFWALATRLMPVMTVGTIHSFCMKLLKQGFFVELNPQLEIIDDIEAIHRVKNILSRWFETNGDSKDVEVFFRHFDELVSAFVSIFSDPELRLMWEKVEEKDVCKNDIREEIEKIFELSSLKDLLREPFPMELIPEKKPPKWVDTVKIFEGLKTRDDFGTKAWFASFSDFLEMRMAGPQKKSSDPAALEYFDGLKAVKDMFRTKKKFVQDLAPYYEHADSTFKNWFLRMKEMFSFINHHYDDLPGVTFADLEYLVYRGIEDDEIVGKIADAYKYFIVDEFQDTSEIQFAILKKIALGKQERIFCVGDVKQAIYGFRGGSLGVFAECEEFVENNYQMSNNYRSKPSIINFNNMFFDFLFKKGEGFKGSDDFTVPVAWQTVPDGIHAEDDKGEIRCIKTSVVVPEGIKNAKVSNFLKSEMEADAIVERIKSIDEGDVCILYSKLAPSKILISKLMKEDMGFTAQVKIPYGEEPLLGITSLLLDTLVDIRNGRDKADAIRYLEVLLDCYLAILGGSSPGKVAELYDEFEGNLLSRGLYASLTGFFYRLNLANSNYNNNLSSLKKYCDLSGGDVSRVVNFLSLSSKDRFSLDFQYGKNCGRIQIMTAHASKGLEFDHVFLGGIHTNGSSKSLEGFCGKLPGSFRWKETMAQKGFYRSPQYMVEQILETKKQFSESKRLFYVACTRAKVTLNWVELSTDEGVLQKGGNSWINGLGAWDMAGYVGQPDKGVYAETRADVTIDEKGLEVKEDERPIFHLDTLGMVANEGSHQERSLVVAPELSVTKLTSLIDCPRKFYLRNICKFGPDDLELLFEEKKVEVEVVQKVEPLEEESDGIQVSSAGRGTFIHERVSEMILRNMVVPNGLAKDEKNALEYAREILLAEKESGAEFTSEKELKFPLFGHMISGIPDLIVRKGANFSVWDFKTGRRKESSEKHYWLQLKCYAYALYVLGICGKDQKINLKLAYLDQKNCVDEDTTWEKVSEEVLAAWSKLTVLGSVNPDHCAFCEFGNMCHPSL